MYIRHSRTFPPTTTPTPLAPAKARSFRTTTGIGTRTFRVRSCGCQTLLRWIEGPKSWLVWLIWLGHVFWFLEESSFLYMEEQLGKFGKHMGWLVSCFFLPLNSFRFYRGSETLKVSQVAVRQIWRFSRLTIDNLNLTSMAGIWLIHLLKMVLKSSVKKVYIGVLGGWFGWVLFFPPKNRGKRGVRKSTLFETTNKLRSHQFIWEDWSNWMTTNNMSMPITIETLILGCNPLTLFGVI